MIISFLYFSDLCKFFGIVSSFIGILVISMALTVIQNLLELTKIQKTNYHILNGINTVEKKKEISNVIVNDYLRLVLGLKNQFLFKHNPNVKNLRDKLLIDISKQKEKKVINRMENPLTKEDLVYIKCEGLEKSISILKKSCANLQEATDSICNKLSKMEERSGRWERSKYKKHTLSSNARGSLRTNIETETEQDTMLVTKRGADEDWLTCSTI